MAAARACRGGAGQSRPTVAGALIAVLDQRACRHGVHAARWPPGRRGGASKRRGDPVLAARGEAIGRRVVLDSLSVGATLACGGEAVGRES